MSFRSFLGIPDECVYLEIHLFGRLGGFGTWWRFTLITKNLKLISSFKGYFWANISSAKL